MSENHFETISKFDRTVGGLQGGNNVDTRPTTLQHIDKITGESEQFTVQTIRNEEGDHVIITFLDKAGVTRLILPPRVVNTMIRQRDAITAKVRSAASKTLAKERMLRGELPGFLKHKHAAK